MIIRCRNYDEAKLQAINILSDFDTYCNKIEISFNKETKSFYVIADDFTIEEYDEIYEIMGE